MVADESVGDLTAIKKLMDDNFPDKYLAVKGNHDGKAFDKVFGSPHGTFDKDGWRFIRTSVDYKSPADFGSYKNVDWLVKQLDTAKADNKNVMLLIHSPIVPKEFKNAEPMLKLVQAYPNVRLLVQGHVHYGVDVKQANGLNYCVNAPLLKKPHEFEVFRVFDDRIEIQHFEAPKGQYGPATRVETLKLAAGAGQPLDGTKGFDYTDFGMPAEPPNPDEIPVKPQLPYRTPDIEPPPVPASKQAGRLGNRFVAPSLPSGMPRGGQKAIDAMLDSIPDLLVKWDLWM